MVNGLNLMVLGRKHRGLVMGQDIPIELVTGFIGFLLGLVVDHLVKNRRYKKIRSQLSSSLQSDAIYTFIAQESEVMEQIATVRSACETANLTADALENRFKKFYDDNKVPYEISEGLAEMPKGIYAKN